MNRILRADEGFTLTELLVTLVVFAILLAIAIPSYLAFRTRGSDSSAKANVRAIVPSIESYYADNGTYAGMTLAGLQATYDQGINPASYSLPAADLSASSYCVAASVLGQTWSKTGAGAIVQAACP